MKRKKNTKTHHFLLYFQLFFFMIILLVSHVALCIVCVLQIDEMMRDGVYHRRHFLNISKSQVKSM